MPKSDKDYLIGLKIFRFYIESAANSSETDIIGNVPLWKSDRWKDDKIRKYRQMIQEDSRTTELTY